MYICPVCGKPLHQAAQTWQCPNRHSFDIAKKGYVNLLTTAKHNPKNAGDNRDMIGARTAFLDRDYYRPLAEKAAAILQMQLSGTDTPMLIDSGCGEGYYTCIYAEHLPHAQIYGIDLSKNAIAHCMTRVHKAGLQNCHFAAASSFALPFPDASADAVISTFAPVSNDEYARVLKGGGKLIVVSPSARHLFELKEVLYDVPYENKPNHYGLHSFTFTDTLIYEYQAELTSNADILNLFSMTPYCYKTAKESTDQLAALQSLTVTCGFVIQTFTKK